MSSSFIDDDQINKSSIRAHIGNDILHAHDSKTGMKIAHMDINLPLVNRFHATRRQKPKSALNKDNLVQSNGYVDFDLSNQLGISDKVVLYLQLTNTGAANINANLFYLVEKIEYLNSQGSVGIVTDDEVNYLSLLFKSQEYIDRIAPVEGLDPVTLNSNLVLTPGQSQKYYLELSESWISAGVKLNTIKNSHTVRVYFNQRGCDTPADLRVDQLDIIVEGTSLTPQLDSLITKNKMNINQKFRTLYPSITREQIDMQPNSEYNFQLKSNKGYSAYGVFFIRPSPKTFANLLDFQQISELELRDNNSHQVGISQDDRFNRYVNSSYFVGDLVNKKNVYVLPFSYDPASSREGQRAGGYLLSGEEFILVRTPASWTPGTYEFVFVSYEYSTLCIKRNGGLYVTRN